MLDGFDFGSPKIVGQLTGKLSTLKSYNGLRIPQDYFWEAMERLRRNFLNVPLSAVLHPSSPTAQKAAKQQKTAAEVAPPVRAEELTAQQWFERGRAAIDREEQVRLYSEAIRLKPDFIEAFNNRGNSRSGKGDQEGAIRDFSAAIQVSPITALPFMNRGIALAKLGELGRALLDFDQAIQLDPHNAVAFHNRGTARREIGDVRGQPGSC